MDIAVRRVEPSDRAEWLRMRAALWPEGSPEEHDAEIEEYLSGNTADGLMGLLPLAVFVAERPGGGLCGFLEASLRSFAEGCTTQPVGYVEGWFVDPDARRGGVGRRLLRAAEEWAAAAGCREMASDAWVSNAVSRSAHKALGFAEEPPVVPFRKELSGGEGPARRQRPRLLPLEDTFAIAQLPPDAPLPPWAAAGPFLSVTRTAEELSVVCRADRVPADVRHEGGWRCLRVAGKLDFASVGILAALVTPLAGAGVSVFAVSTFDTDYLLVKAGRFAEAVEALRRAGHTVG